MKLKSWPNPLAIGQTLFSRNDMWALVGSFFLHFPFQIWSFPPRKLHAVGFSSPGGSPSELWGSNLILFSYNGLEKSTQMAWDKLVTWIKRRGRRWLGDFYPGVATLGKFEKDNCIEPPYISPAESTHYLFSISSCL